MIRSSARAAMVLVNTDRAEGEQLADQVDLNDLSGRFRAGPAGGTATTPELEAVRGAARRIREIWAVADDEEETVRRGSTLS